MLCVAICEDDLYEAQNIQKDLKVYLEEIGLSSSIHCYTSAREFMGAVMNKQIEPNLVLLDIELGEESGIDIVKKLMLFCPKVQIAYCTNHLHYATDVYETNHCYYILKQEFKKRLPSLMKKVMESQKEEEEKIIVQIVGEQKVVKQADIYYIERRKKVSIIMTQKECVQVAADLNTIMKNLNPIKFIRCHNSYIINLSQVKNYKRSSFELCSDTLIPISRSYIEDVKKAFSLWVKMQQFE